MADIRDNKIRDEVKRLAGEYLLRESNFTSLVTITDVRISDHGKRAVILFTVLPESKQVGCLDFLKRKRSDFREYATQNSRIGRVPFFDFEVDTGEKNRQNIEKISTAIGSGEVSSETDSIKIKHTA